MKFLKKALSLILVLAVALSLGIPVLAAQEPTTGSITITNTVPGTEYKVYRIFDLESFSGDAYSYKVRPDNTWKEFAESIACNGTDASGLIQISNDYITPTNNSNPETWTHDLISNAQKWIKENSCTFDGFGKVDPGKDSVTIDNLPSGYYFVDTALGTGCFLNTVADPSLSIAEKNEPPTVDKNTFDDDPTMDPDHKKSDANVGDFVKFTAAIHVKKGAVGYKLVDSMSDGLVFEQDAEHLLTVQTNDGRTLSDPIPAGKETWTLEGKNGDPGFNVIFNDDFIAKQINKDILVTYYGKLTQEAVITDADAASNSAKIQYGENSALESKPSETKTYTYDLKVIKYTEKEGNKIALAGAQFQLSKFEKLSGNAVKDPITMTASGNNYIVDPKGKDTTITTDATGVFTVQGLDAGVYYLHEIESPAGYNKLAAPIKINIDHNGVVTYGNNNAVTGSDFEVQQQDGALAPIEGAVPVLNQTGSELPTTGGIGTTVFYVVGALMMLCALVLLITRKKLSGHKKTN